MRSVAIRSPAKNARMFARHARGPFGFTLGQALGRAHKTRPEDDDPESGGNKKRGQERPRSSFSLYLYYLNLAGAKWTFGKKYICRRNKRLGEKQRDWGLDRKWPAPQIFGASWETGKSGRTRRDTGTYPSVSQSLSPFALRPFTEIAEKVG